ncbi:MAG: hypothetical protein KF716_32350 [Anaerolineae bacterium]|nr:hypothetical protein [Anaerolineae bacterium]
MLKQAAGKVAARFGLGLLSVLHQICDHVHRKVERKLCLVLFGELSLQAGNFALCSHNGGFPFIFAQLGLHEYGGRVFDALLPVGNFRLDGGNMLFREFCWFI